MRQSALQKNAERAVSPGEHVLPSASVKRGLRRTRLAEAQPRSPAAWGLGIALTLLLLGLPLAGILARGEPIAPYLAFPPLTGTGNPAPWSGWVFAFMALGIILVCYPFVRETVRAARRSPSRPSQRPFPWWGWAGLAFGALAWLVAWNRFAWAAPIQAHSFTPLWLGFIVVVNALAYRRTGRCMMVHRPRFFVALFPVSAAFWWFFEYLNRFVSNWHYTGISDFSAGEYVLFASLSFSTVLPAVLGVCEWLASFPAFAPGEKAGADRSFLLRPVSVGLLLLSAVGLAGIGTWPNLLYPLLWLAPLFILVALLELGGTRALLSEGLAGHGNRIRTAAAAALICGFFWEMWNWHSLARWVYDVPFVEALHVFEMPLLGYAGYLPFGLACLAIGDLVGAAVDAAAVRRISEVHLTEESKDLHQNCHGKGVITA